jgi:O-antigen ligase
MVCLLIGHIALKTFFPSILINLVAIAFIGLILFHVLNNRRDVFGFIMIIYLCSHFQYTPNQGGLFNLLAFALATFYLLRFRVHETIGQDLGMQALLWVLIICNVLGWVLVTPASVSKVVLGAASFLGYMLMFYIASNIRIDATRLRSFLIVLCVIVLYNFVVSLNHTYSVIKLVTPLLGLGPNTLYATTNAFGVFANGTINGEYNMMMFAFLIPFLQPAVLRRELDLKLILFFLVALLCAVTVVLSNSRGSAIMVALIVVFYGFLFSVRYRRVHGVLKNLNLILLTGVLILSLAGAYLGFADLMGDLLKVHDVSLAGVVSGKDLNRFGVWQFGWHRLMQDNWLIGYGHGVPEVNSIAESGSVHTSGTHLHNLYLILPMLYGWIGAGAYLSLFIITVARLLRVVRNYDARNYLVAFCMGMLVAWIGFFAEEFISGVMIQENHYPMIIWILLGLSNAAVKSIRLEASRVVAVRKAEAGPRPVPSKVI